MQDSILMGGSGPGKVDDKKLPGQVRREQWGGLPPAERAKVVEEVTRATCRPGTSR